MNYDKENPCFSGIALTAIVAVLLEDFIKKETPSKKKYKSLFLKVRNRRIKK